MSRERAWLATANAQGVTDRAGDVLLSVLAALPGVAVAFLQEVAPLTGRQRLRALLSRLVGVHQVTTTAATAGSALVWDKSRATARGRGLVRGSRGSRLGRGVRDRWLAWVDLELDSYDGRRPLTIRCASGHAPLESTGRQGEFVDAVERFAAASPHPVIVGLDANDRQPNVRGLVWLGVGIDGLLVSPSLLGRLGHPTPLDGVTRSDHRAVVVPVTL